MDKLIVKMPCMARSTRSRNSSTVEQSVSKAKSSAERVRKYRERKAQDAEWTARNRIQKQEENRKYKEKVKNRRQQNTVTDAACKAKQNQWKQASRAREEERNKELKIHQTNIQERAQLRRQEKLEQKEKEAARRTSTPGSIEKSITPVSASTTRKRAQRVRASLPSSPKGWSQTLNYIIDKATPRRKALLSREKGKNSNTQSDFMSILQLKKVGRPSKSISEVKKRLMFASPSLVRGKIGKKYIRRKKAQAAAVPKVQKAHSSWESRLGQFLERNSRIMPNKRDTILLPGGQRVAKRHLLNTKYKTFCLFKKEHPGYIYGYSTFKKHIPMNMRRLKMSNRRVCVCLKDYNLEKKVEALNKICVNLGKRDISTTIRELSDLSLCQYSEHPSKKCVERKCDECGIDNISVKYRPLVDDCTARNLPSPSWWQWEQVSDTYVNKKGEKKTTKAWKQVKKSCSVPELVEEVSTTVEVHSNHLFRIAYQHRVETAIMENLPMNHAIAVMDFSENIALQAQDEIESAHWNNKQVTLHPTYLVRHAPTSTIDIPVLQRESLVALSDDLKHDSVAVLAFTRDVLVHIEQNPGPKPIEVLHRFSDNCATQYKSKEAFSHMTYYPRVHGVEVRYHYTESGHGKGPSDGIGATVKQKLERLILSDKVVVNSAYDVYLALSRELTEVAADQPNFRKKAAELSHRRFLYVPRRKIRNKAPEPPENIKAVKGTQSFHFVKLCSRNTSDHIILHCEKLSCHCRVCLGIEAGPCWYGQYRDPPLLADLCTGVKASKEILVIEDATTHTSTYTGTGMSGGGEQNLHRAEAQSLQSCEDHEIQVATHMSTFDQDIAPKGWRVRGHTPSDGNCMFWAASDQLDKLSAGNHTQETLRNITIAHLKALSQNEQEDLEHFLVDQNFQEYIAYLEPRGSYADQMAVKAMAAALKCQVRIVTPDGEDIMIGSDGPQLVLGFIPHLRHYVSLDKLHRTPEVDNFVAVWLDSSAVGTTRRKPCKRLFLAKVMQMGEAEGQQNLQLKYLQPQVSVERCVYKWSTDDDWSWQSPEDIAKVLTHPTLLTGRGIRFQFLKDEINRLK